MMETKRIASRVIHPCRVIPNPSIPQGRLSAERGIFRLAPVEDSSEDTSAASVQALGMTGGVAALEAEIQQGMAELREMLS